MKIRGTLATLSARTMSLLTDYATLQSIHLRKISETSSQLNTHTLKENNNNK